MSAEAGFGRRVPPDWAHREKYPFRSVAPPTVAEVERALELPGYRHRYDQQSEGACVGFAASWMMSILNRRLYDARWLWNESKKIDDWPDTNPGDANGTSVRAALDVLRNVGHCRVDGDATAPAELGDGILENRWAETVDEVRTALANGNPVTLGVHWYTNFDAPVEQDGEWWIGRGGLGEIRAGHAVCIYGASDRLQAVRIVNNWGDRYPLVLLPYPVLTLLLHQDGEASLITDRQNAEAPGVATNGGGAT